MLTLLTDLGVSDFAGGAPTLNAWINNQAWHILFGLYFALTWWPANLPFWAVWMTKEAALDIPGAAFSWPVIIDSITDLVFGLFGVVLARRATRGSRS